MAQTNHITEMQVFKMLDNLRATASGLDGIPAWFLRLKAAIFAAPLTQLFNQSISEGIVSQQWRTSCNHPGIKSY